MRTVCFYLVQLLVLSIWFCTKLKWSFWCKCLSNYCFRFCYFFPSYLTPVFIPCIDLVYKDFVHTWDRLSWLSRHLLKRMSGWPVGDRFSLNLHPVKIHTKQRISSLIFRSHLVVDFLRQGDGYERRSVFFDNWVKWSAGLIRSVFSSNFCQVIIG